MAFPDTNYMNILYTSYFGEGFGGAEVSLGITAKAVQGLGNCVFIASSGDFSRFGVKTIPFRKFVGIPAFRIHEAYLSRFLKKMVLEKKIDIVHANDRLTSVAAVLAAKSCNVPAIVHFRDYWFGCPKSTFLKKNLENCEGCNIKNLLSCAELRRFPWNYHKSNYLKHAREIIKTADAKVAISGAVKERLDACGIFGAKIIPNPIGMQNTEIDIVKIKSALRLKNTVVTFIGNLDNNKGILQIFDVMSGILKARDDVSFLVVGNGRLMQKLQKRISEEGLRDSVVLVGWLPREEMTSAYAMSDIVVVPSLWAEPFARVAIEAMAAGRVVLASNIGGLKEILSPEQLIQVFDKQQWCENISALIDDDNKRKTIGYKNAGQARIYEPMKIAKALCSIYNALKNHASAL